MDQIGRRRLLLASAALALAPAVMAQQRGKVWRVGFLVSRSSAAIKRAGYDTAFLNALRELRYVDGKNVIVDWRFAEGNYDRLPGLAAELVQLKPDVIVAWAPPGIRAAMQATKTVPIVMTGAGDPIANGFVASLSRPGGNVTGISNLAVQLTVKDLDILRAAMPKLARVGLLVNPSNPSYNQVSSNLQTSANRSGVKLIRADARTESEIDAAFGTVVHENAAALIVAPDAFFVSRVEQIVRLAVKHRLPSIYSSREYAEAGGLMSYGQNLAEHFRLAAVYVDKIFKGAKPGELPIEQPTKVELVVNLKTAKKLGLSISRDFLARVDEVIQ